MADLFIAVDPALERSPYLQIIEQIAGLIARGDLQAGTQLPTVRQLAGDLNVAPNTVARAYSDLQEGGWLVSDGRRGTRVARRSFADDQRARSRTLRETIAQFMHTLERRGYSQAEIAEAIERALPT